MLVIFRGVAHYLLLLILGNIELINSYFYTSVDSGVQINMANLNPSHATKQILAGYCGILFGGFGLHKFVLGYTLEGFIMLVISLVGGSFTYGFALIIMQLVGLIEGMIYLNKTHDQFVATYFTNKQGWF